MATTSRGSEIFFFGPSDIFFEDFTSLGPNTSLEGALGWFLGVKPLLRRYLDPEGLGINGNKEVYGILFNSYIDY